ncbi:MAG: TatD family hydrolase [Collinsella sp.]|nr:TatD family hydrolase [Collinsella sp.]
MSAHQAARGGDSGVWRILDAHCHLDKVADPRMVARQAQELGLGFLCTTVSPADAIGAQALFSGLDNVMVGIGLHPWRIADGSCGDEGIRHAIELVAKSRYIGEIGIDASRRHGEMMEKQVQTFEAMARSCAEHPIEGRVLSIHAVHTGTIVLDILEKLELTSTARCIFHWFSGTGDELLRARRAGCLFSIGLPMLATRRGRSYASQIPLDSLLVETDAPSQWGSRLSATDIASELEEAIGMIASARSMSYEEVEGVVRENCQRVFAHAMNPSPKAR